MENSHRIVDKKTDNFRLFNIFSSAIPSTFYIPIHKDQEQKR